MAARRAAAAGQSTASWLLSRLLSAAGEGLGVPASWIPILGAAAAAPSAAAAAAAVPSSAGGVGG
jgi:hypothetical protein